MRITAITVSYTHLDVYKRQLAAYAKNPKHVAVADTKVRPFTENRACMDFEV